MAEATDNHERVRAYEIAAYLSAASFPLDIAEGPPSEPVPSSDTTLNALVQHGVHKMDCDRAFLSLIDNRNQFICAEMTRHQSLSSADPGDPLLLGTARIALEWGVCPYAMSLFHGRPVSLPDSPYIVADKSYFCIKDFRQIPTFAERPFVAGYPHMVSYLEIPLFAMSGHILGSYCVVDTKERDFLHPTFLDTIREIALAISAYLDMRRVEACRSRSAKMMRGLRNFVASEERDMASSSVASEPSRAHKEPFDLHVFGATSRRETGATTRVTGSNPIQPFSAYDPSPVVSSQDTDSKAGKVDFSTQVDNLFVRAADNIGNAMDLDGLVFFDTVSTGTQHRSCQIRDASLHDTSSPTNDLFAVPLSYYQRNTAVDQLKLRQSLIQRLTARYPRGHVFAVDEYGVLQHDSHDGLGSHEDDGSDELFSSLPKIRYVVFLPMFHNQREACYATCLAWVSDTGKTLDSGDVNSLTAFSNSLMAEIFRLEASENTLSKSDFVSTISHELRSPLHGILASIELIQENCQGSSLMSEMTMIESCASTLLDTFDHLLEYSKVNSRASVAQRGGSGPNHATTHVQDGAVAVDLASMVEDVVEIVSVGHDHSSRLVSGLKNSLAEHPETARIEPVIVTTHIETDRDWTFVVEKGAWKRILLNVVSNALKYTRSGYIHVDLGVVEVAEDRQAYISFSVTDTGIGMSEDFLKYHLFTPFTQENILSPGTGLGLSLVKIIVESLQGTISVSSCLGKGTKVTVNIPADQTMQRPSCPDTNSFSPQERLRGKTIGLLSLSFHGEPGNEYAPSITPPPEVLERSIRNICEDRFGMSVTVVSKDIPPVLDIVLIDVRTLTPALAHDLKTLFPAYKASDLPVVIELCNTNGTAYKTGPSRSMHTVLVTGKSLGSALIAALDDATTKGTADSVPSTRLEIRYEMELKEHSARDHVVEKVDPHIRRVTLAHRALSSQDTSPADAATVPALQPQPPTQLYIHFTPSPKCRFRRLLLVDDNPINLKLLCAFAKRLNVAYSSATDGAEAVHLYQAATEQDGPQMRYDCIFLDISMPVMDGFQAVTKIRRIEDETMEKDRQAQSDDAMKHDLDSNAGDNRSVRAYIFALTGLGSEKARKQARNSGFDEFLLKPVRFKNLLPLLAPLPTP